MSSTPPSKDHPASGSKGSKSGDSQSPTKSVDRVTGATFPTLLENRSPRDTLTQMDIRGDEVPPPTLQTPTQQTQETASGTDRKDWAEVRRTEQTLKDESARQAGAKKQEDC
ncbi:hypothetical protein FKW77_001158 [Venturia effusa]|uniref:Uncharacterized protein n=1 Tax=Venturia effusa TaxID=50376 RepID=A0A517LNB0_9PEZI|nr:hypothetical protein FKW77_001158 [Venturia effusa]